jgi:hypothetical protein
VGNDEDAVSHGPSDADTRRVDLDDAGFADFADCEQASIRQTESAEERAVVGREVRAMQPSSLTWRERRQPHETGSGTRQRCMFSGSVRHFLGRHAY